MIKALSTMLAALMLMQSAPGARTVFAMKTGILLRMHVIAQDDTPRMQQIKLAVRDGVRSVYAALPEEGTMLQRARAALPRLTQAARTAAAQAGFCGTVQVELTRAAFDERELDGLRIPAGEYPALVIRLGDAQGRNWWGLIDPTLALRCAGEDSAFDWSLRRLLESLFGLRAGGAAHE